MGVENTMKYDERVAYLAEKCKGYPMQKLCKAIRRATRSGEIKLVGALMAEYERRTLPKDATPEEQLAKTTRDLESLKKRYPIISGGFGF